MIKRNNKKISTVVEIDGFHKKIRRSHFAIFVIVSLIATTGLVLWFNTIVIDSLETTDSTVATDSIGVAPHAGSQMGHQGQELDSATATRLREMRPADKVTSAPSLDTQGRTNLFSE